MCRLLTERGRERALTCTATPLTRRCEPVSEFPIKHTRTMPTMEKSNCATAYSLLDRPDLKDPYLAGVW